MRKSINSTEVHRHKNPIPHASIIKGLMISSAISGIDNKTGNYPKEKNTQIGEAFNNMHKILKEANADFKDVLKVDLYFNDKSDRKYVNPIWMKLFPDDNNMPARHSHLASLDGDCIMQIVFTAVVSS